MYEGLSGQARAALHLAHQEAQRLGHDYVGTEHLLLGVLREGSEGVAQLLTAVGRDARSVCREVEANVPSGPGGARWDKLPLTPAAKRALDHAREEAASLGHPCVGPEHLLLGVLREPEGSAAQLAQPLGITLQVLRPGLVSLPAPENRDWMLQPPAAPGVPLLAGPSVRDLEAVVTAQVLPAERVPTERERTAREPAPRPRVRPDQAQLDLPIVEWQLRAMQYAVAGVAGAFVGITTQGLAGAVIGYLVGCALAAVRSSVLGAVTGLLAGGIWGALTQPDTPPGVIFGAAAGGFLGAFLGDWRRWRAPPGSG
jgi:hypothetical protein